MTILESHRILIGAAGWLHDKWQEGFYPEDLPEDWYLGYYGNEFPVVSIREKEWQQGDVEEWLEETDDVPLFICELPLQAYNEGLLEKAEQYLAAARQMAERCVGIICHVNHCVNISELKELLPACQAVAPTVLAMPDTPTEIQTLMVELAINPLWDNPESNHNNDGNIYIAKLDSALVRLPELRTVMENLLAQQVEQKRLVVLIDGEQPDLEIIKQAKVMLDLL